jgi:iron(III) transport system substrate-binding protein
MSSRHSEFFLRVLSILAVLSACMLTCVPKVNAASAKLNEIIDKARKEGEIVYQAPDPETGLPTNDYLQEMSNLAEKLFGVRITVKIDNALNFPGSVAKAITEIKSGAPPSYDLMFQNSISGIPLYTSKLVEPIPWLEIIPSLTPKSLEWKGLVPIVDTQFLLPIYNTRLVKAQDVPKSYDDLLNPKWKGKLAAFINYEPWALLSHKAVWGEEKALGYLRKLLELDPKIGRFPETFQRVLSGESHMAVHGQRERTLFYRDKKAPMAIAESVEPGLVWVYVLAIPKGARNANAATLIAASLLTKEGQALHQKYRYTTSMFQPGTPAAAFAAKHKVIVPDVDFLTSKQFEEVGKTVRSIMVRQK